MGGRGAGSLSGGGGGGTIIMGNVESLGLAGQTGFYGGNKVSVASTLNHWEGKSYDLDHEELLMIGEDGFATAYFKGDNNSVGFTPPSKKVAAKTTLTHNHPLGDGRTKGGSFSDADLRNHIKCGFKETRATAVEGTYSFKTTSKSDSSGFLKALGTRKATVSKRAASVMKKKPNSNAIDVYLDESHKWYQQTASKYGYEYTFTKR